MSSVVRWALAMLLVGLWVPAWAQGEAKASESESAAFAPASAHGLVDQVTQDILAVVANNKASMTDNPQKYYGEVSQVLEPVVAFDYIAKIVMAQYYKDATDAQREAFAETFKNSMVETFAKGMANYSDFDIAVQPPEGDISDQRKVEVIQEVKTNDGKHIVSYTMAKARAGEWKLINVVLNGINLGKSFRDQFTQAAVQQSGDIDKVIATWGQRAQ